MTDKASAKNQNQKSSPIIILAIAILAAWFVYQDPARFVRILAILAGFGAVIFVHELGHFLAAKSVGILVEAFAIGFGPIFLGFRKVPGGMLVRILPTILQKPDGEAALTFKIPLGNPAGKEGETEYQIRLIPLGGFVKMLGQEDMGADEVTDDPRAYNNKKVGQRSLVISAGVIMNIISAAIVFVIVFSVGIEQPPAMIGDVIEGMPASQAGLQGGDRILAIDGKDNNLSFMHIIMAGAFADKGQQVTFTVEHPDGSIEDIAMEPRPSETNTTGVRMFGIEPPTSLTIGKFSPDDKASLEALQKAGLNPQDTVVAVNGQPIEHYSQLRKELYPWPGTLPSLNPNITFKSANSEEIKTIEVPLALRVTDSPIDPQKCSVLGLVPRLKISTVSPNSPAEKAGLQTDDVITRIGSQKNPTYTEMTRLFEESVNKEIIVTVQRREEGKVMEKDLALTPCLSGTWWKALLGFEQRRAIIGFFPTRDLDSNIILNTVALENKKEALPIPRGSRITAVNGEEVRTFQEITLALMDAQGKDIEISYQAPDSDQTEKVAATVPNNSSWTKLAFRPTDKTLRVLPIMLEPYSELFKGKSLAQSLGMGLSTTGLFISQTYFTIKGMVNGTVSTSAAQGPVGILRLSYRIIQERSIIEYLHFLAMLSAIIAVFNFLPIPVVDGGHMLFLIIEKIKGSPVSVKVQEVSSYIGLALLLSLFLYITWNDIAKAVTGQL